jgi:hypothetical protein
LALRLIEQFREHHSQIKIKAIEALLLYFEQLLQAPNSAEQLSKVSQFKSFSFSDRLENI